MCVRISACITVSDSCCNSCCWLLVLRQSCGLFATLCIDSKHGSSVKALSPVSTAKPFCCAASCHVVIRLRYQGKGCLGLRCAHLSCMHDTARTKPTRSGYQYGYSCSEAHYFKVQNLAVEESVYASCISNVVCIVAVCAHTSSNSMVQVQSAVNAVTAP